MLYNLLKPIPMKKILSISILIMAIAFSCTKDGAESGGVSTGGDAGQSGQGGSMAKFSISGNHLFLINEHDLNIYNITNEAEPQKINSVHLEIGIETVFTLADYLFIGSNNGMYIYDISDPSNLKYLSFYNHITSCDPVVANDSLAFVTLNTVRSCNWQNGSNRLDILDINNKIDPQLLYSQVMSSPLGLGLYDHYVFVCDGINGVEYYDFSNPNSLEYMGKISGIDSYDLIIRDQILFLIGEDGLFQYDISDINDISLISNILF